MGGLESKPSVWEETAQDTSFGNGATAKGQTSASLREGEIVFSAHDRPSLAEFQKSHGGADVESPTSASTMAKPSSITSLGGSNYLVSRANHSEHKSGRYRATMRQEYKTFVKEGLAGMMSVDMFQTEPRYKWQGISTWISKLLSLATIVITVLYMTYTTRQFVITPPQINQRGRKALANETNGTAYIPPAIGFSIRTTVRNNETGKRENIFVNASNADRYFSFQVYHRVLENFGAKEHDRTVLSGGA